jgi:hypothetical protein
MSVPLCVCLDLGRKDAETQKQYEGPQDILSLKVSQSLSP